MTNILNIDKKFGNESIATARYLKQIRTKNPGHRIRKIPDVWRKLKPVDVIVVTDKKIKFIEFKHIKLKKVYIDDRKRMSTLLMSKLEPLQVITLSKTSKLEIAEALIVARIESENCFYHISYQDAKKSKLG